MLSYIDLSDKNEIIAMDARNETKRQRFYRNNYCVDNRNGTDTCNIGEVYQSVYSFDKNDLELVLNGFQMLKDERDAYFTTKLNNIDEYVDCLTIGQLVVTIFLL